MNTSPEGMIGEPLPYLLHTDWIITALMFLCVLTVTYVLSKEKKYLLQQLKAFPVNRKRSSMFDGANTIDMRYILLLIFHTCVLLGFCAYYHVSNHTPSLLEKIPHALLLGSFVTIMGCLLFLKWILYSFVNWIFFQKESNSAWITSYFNLFIWLGIFLLPIILVIIYFDISSQNTLYLIGSSILIAKIALFWKCFRNFFEKIYGALHLILYFCALEILPDLILWKGIELVSNNLT